MSPTIGSGFLNQVPTLGNSYETLSKTLNSPVAAGLRTSVSDVRLWLWRDLPHLGHTQKQCDVLVMDLGLDV